MTWGYYGETTGVDGTSRWQRGLRCENIADRHRAWLTNHRLLLCCDWSSGHPTILCSLQLKIDLVHHIPWQPFVQWSVTSTFGQYGIQKNISIHPWVKQRSLNRCNKSGVSADGCFISDQLKLFITCTLPIFLYGCERCIQDWCKVFANAVRNQMVPPCAEQWGETDNQATTPFGCCPNTVFLPVCHIAWMPDETDAKQILTASPLENWRRPPGRRSTTWMKTICRRQDGCV